MKTNYDAINARLKDDDIRQAVKESNYVYITKELLKLFNENDDGKHGKIFEVVCGFFVKGYRGNIMVSAKGHIDITFKGKKHECKINCGSFLADITKNDYMIYSYNGKADCKNPANAHVIPMAEFLQGLEECGLFRKSKHTSAKGLTMAIQSYANSKRKLAMWTGFIDKYPTLAEYKAGA